uniref:DUF1003 domain-containing protein n=1 Tax=Solibacter usitatus (strain Ellin6076) TaxID=234267 RepID=Q01XV8_SOLUE
MRAVCTCVNSNQEALASAVRRNIDAIVRMEADYTRQRSCSDRIADSIGDFSGSMPFVVLHIVFYGTWILVNLGIVRVAPRFDPFPFMLLSMVVGVEAIFLSTFVLMKQKRMSQRADERAHLDLQINLLAEREMTLVLQMLQGISTKLGVPTVDEEVKELAEETPLEVVAEELQKAMAPEGGEN